MNLSDPWRALAGAIGEQAVADLQAPRLARRRDAVEYIYSSEFAELLEMAGIEATAADCRAALRASGRLPEPSGDKLAKDRPQCPPSAAIGRWNGV